MVGSEMYDDGFGNSNSDEDNKNQEFDFGPSDENHYNKPEDLDYPNIDSPRVTMDLRKDRTLVFNSKLGTEGECSYDPDESVMDIPNESNPMELKRRLSSVNSQADYEVIGDNLVRETITLKRAESENNKENIGHKKIERYNSDTIKVSRTDKGFSEISQMKKKNLSVLVGICLL
jgi:hypothetical protein